MLLNRNSEVEAYKCAMYFVTIANHYGKGCDRETTKVKKRGKTRLEDVMRAASVD